MGGVGVRLVLQRLALSEGNLARLAELIAANERDERCELLWGSPGTILAGRELGLEVSGSIDWLRGKRDPDGLWTQQLYGASTRYLGPGHGFAGCVLALGDDGSASDTLRRYAVWEGGLNCTRSRRAGLRRVPTVRSAPSGATAPGIVATLGQTLDEGLAAAGAELTWKAGPLRKGANLATAVRVTATRFSPFFERTGDERWLERARAFAMHALAQVDDARPRVRPRSLHALDG